MKKRDSGTAAAVAGLPTSVVAALDAAMMAFKPGKPTFHSDLVWKKLSPGLRSVIASRPNAIGSVFNAYARTKKIKRVPGSVPSIRENARGRHVQTWRFV